MTAAKLVLGGAVLAAVLAASAQAADPYYAGYGWGCTTYPPLNGYSPGEHVPYFALYPPVYYGQIVPRTYGQSPFAYPATMAAPPSQDVVVAAADRPPAPLLVINPYVSQPAEVSHPAGAGGTALVVYPAR